MNEADANDVIKVARGTYDEGPQLVIDKNLSILGAKRKRPVIRPTEDTGSTGDSRGWFLVAEGIQFNLKSVVLDGSGKKVWQAIRHRGTGKIEDVKFTEIKFEPSGPSYSGVGVAAFGSSGPVHFKRCTFREMGRIGVLYFGSGISGSIFSKNTYRGKGNGNFLDYCLDVSAGAQVVIWGNKISDCRGVASVDGSTSAGILITTFFDPGTSATIKYNLIQRNTTGIAVGFDSDEESVVDVRFNKIFYSESHGIDIETLAPDNMVISNKVYRNGSDGIRFIGDNSTVKSNAVKANEGDGISISGENNLIVRNSAWKNDGNGFNIDGESSGNELKKNKSFKNAAFGYKDDSTGPGTSGTDNNYVRNSCWRNASGGSDPAGLCTPQP